MSHKNSAMKSIYNTWAIITTFIWRWQFVYTWPNLYTVGLRCVLYRRCGIFLSWHCCFVLPLSKLAWNVISCLLSAWHFKALPLVASTLGVHRQYTIEVCGLVASVKLKFDETSKHAGVLYICTQSLLKYFNQPRKCSLFWKLLTKFQSFFNFPR